jgi:hypothetical protein
VAQSLRKSFWKRCAKLRFGNRDWGYTTSSSVFLTAKVRVKVSVPGPTRPNSISVYYNFSRTKAAYAFAENNVAGGRADGEGKIDSATCTAAAIGINGDYPMMITESTNLQGTGTIAGSDLVWDSTASKWVGYYDIGSHDLSANGYLYHPVTTWKDDQGSGSCSLATGTLATVTNVSY